MSATQPAADGATATAAATPAAARTRTGAARLDPGPRGRDHGPS